MQKNLLTGNIKIIFWHEFYDYFIYVFFRI